MPIENYDIVGSYNNQIIPSIDAERTVNMFEYRDQLAKKNKMLLPTSGIKNSGVSFGATTGGFRASFVFLNNTYHVIGNAVWLVQQIGNTLVPTQLNSNLPLTTSVGYVGMDGNATQVIFVDGAKGYIYDTILGQFLKITDFSFPANPIDVTTLDGFFVVANGNTPNFQLSSLNMGMNWGPSSNLFTTNFAVHPTFFAIGNSTISGPTGTQNYATGTPIIFTKGTNGGDALPTTTPVDISSVANQGITFYAVQVVTGGIIDTLNIQVASSLANAQAGVVLTITNNGTNVGANQKITSTAQLQLGSISTHPGNIVACRTLHRRLFLFSTFFTEVWENSGIGTTLPFRRNNSIVMEYGTPAVGSVAVSFDMMFYMSQSKDGLGPVMMVLGTESIPVSNKALNTQLSQYAQAGQIADCRSFLIRENGITFYRMNFTLANHTFVYNASQSNPQNQADLLWHEEMTLNSNRHVAQTHIFYNGSNYVGDFASPILYIVSANLYTNDGEAIHRMRIPRAFVPPGYQRIRIDRLQVDLLQGQVQQGLIFDNINLDTETSIDILTENGINIITEQTEPINQVINPVLFMAISKDGGQVYGNDLTAPMGNIGERTFRTVFRKLGTTKRGQAFVTRFDFYDPIPFYILGASWFYEVLPE